MVVHIEATEVADEVAVYLEAEEALANEVAKYIEGAKVFADEVAVHIKGKGWAGGQCCDQPGALLVDALLKEKEVERDQDNVDEQTVKLSEAVGGQDDSRDQPGGFLVAAASDQDNDENSAKMTSRSQVGR